MNKKILGILCVIVIIMAIGIVASVNMIDSQEETSLIITSNSTLYSGDNITVKLVNESNGTIANKTIKGTLSNDNGTNITLSAVTGNDGVAVFNVTAGSGNYSVNCSYEGDDEYKSSTAQQDLTIIDKSTNNVYYEAPSLRYNEDDHLSSEELKEKYSDLSDEELLDRFGERGQNGIMYSGKHVWEDRGDGYSYGGNPIY